ncbi:uncharacterized protein [Procambarus clarkii]|uniref:uncharacterized protein n=1 Tax=Procambarus clarkii TaxID=6728 RepID=UPI0037424E09
MIPLTPESLLASKGHSCYGTHLNESFVVGPEAGDVSRASESRCNPLSSILASSNTLSRIITNNNNSFTSNDDNDDEDGDDERSISEGENVDPLSSTNNDDDYDYVDDVDGNESSASNDIIIVPTSNPRLGSPTDRESTIDSSSNEDEDGDGGEGGDEYSTSSEGSYSSNPISPASSLSSLSLSEDESIAPHDSHSSSSQNRGGGISSPYPSSHIPSPPP